MPIKFNQNKTICLCLLSARALAHRASAFPGTGVPRDSQASPRRPVLTPVPSSVLVVRPGNPEWSSSELLLTHRQAQPVGVAVTIALWCPSSLFKKQTSQGSNSRPGPELRANNPVPIFHMGTRDPEVGPSPAAPSMHTEQTQTTTGTPTQGMGILSAAHSPLRVFSLSWVLTLRYHIFLCFSAAKPCVLTHASHLGAFAEVPHCLRPWVLLCCVCLHFHLP